MKTLIIALLLLSNIALADSIYLGAYSYHINKSPTVTNDNHKLLAYEKNSYVAGTYVNSFGDRAYIVGKRIKGFDIGDIKISAMVGAVYGYYSCKTGKEPTENASQVVCPALVPEISYTKYDIQPSILILGNAIALSVKVAL